MAYHHFLSTIPVFPSADIQRDIAWYEKQAGFSTIYADAMYAVIYRDNTWLHLQWHADTANDPLLGGSVARIGVAAVEPLFNEMLERGTVGPSAFVRNTPWQTNEFGFRDLNNNILFFMQDLIRPAAPQGNERPTLGHGKICYLEMPSENPEASAAFYKKVFGWQSRQRGDGSLAFDDGVGEVSGVWTSRLQSTSQPGMITYIMVKDAEAVLQLIRENGGTVVREIGEHHPEITARFADPFGNVFGIYQEAGL
jgi:predicted enzyme related to lactoylglutathione lyase